MGETTEPGGQVRAVDRFDMVVIGSGPAGEKAAAQAAYFRKRVAVVERSPSPGGAVVLNGEIPSKTLRETALYITGFRRREVYGLGLTLDPEATVAQLRARTAQVVETSTDAVRQNLERHAIEFVHGRARLGSERTVHVTLDAGQERALQGRVVLIATGSRPFHPPSVPFDDPDVHDSETVLDIDRPFSSLVVVGGGAVGCEYASIFTAIGVRVTLADSGARLLSFFDGEISELLARAFSGMGMRLVLGRGRAAVGRDDSGLTCSLSSGEEIRTDKVLFASGRVGNVEGLGLEEAGVQVDARNRILVDEEFRTTSTSPAACSSHSAACSAALCRFCPPRLDVPSGAASLHRRHRVPVVRQQVHIDEVEGDCERLVEVLREGV
jgi:NAD(P) transhydrogenase